jgi:chloramphenicol-sensitive protein RarD
VLQLSVGLFVYHEPMPPARLAGFTLVWFALALFTWDALHRRSRTAAALRKLVDEKDALRTP